MRREALTATLLLLATSCALGQGTIRVESTSTHLNLVQINAADTQETDFYPADVDNDGDIDVLVGRKLPFTNNGPRSNLLLINDGLGNLVDMTANHTSWVTHLNNTRDIEASDMNGDGWLDVICYNSHNAPTEIFLNNGTNGSTWQGFASTPINVQTTASTFHCCDGRTLDYDLDGMMDIVRANYFGGASDDLMRQSSSMVFTQMNSLLPSTFWSSSFGTTTQTRNHETGAMLDFNLDGNQDILLAASSDIKAAYTDGLGGFLASNTNWASPATYAGVAADFDNDGRPDVFKVNDGTDTWHRNLSNATNGSINESASESIGSSGGFGANASAYDFNGDGLTDVFVHSVDVDIANCGNSNALKLFLNTGGTPRFQLDTAMVFPTSTYDSAVADFDGDGVLDILLSGCGNAPGYRYYLSDPNAMNQVFASKITAQPNFSFFEVEHIPTANGAVNLYNFFDPDTSDPLGSGPFIGLSAAVVLQVGFGSPFTVNVPAGTEDFSFFIPPVPIPQVRIASALYQPATGMFAFTDVTEWTLTQ